MSKRLQPTVRKDQILDAAITVAQVPGGWSTLTRAAVAKAADCAEALPSKYFTTMTQFRRAIMRAAIERGNLSIVAQGLAAGDNCALKAPPELKKAAVASLAGV